MKKLSLRIRLTVLTAILLTAACVILTVCATFLVRFLYKVETPDFLENAENLIIRERRFNYYSIGAMIIVIISGTAAAYFIAGKALKPATDLSKEIEQRDEDDLFSPVDYFDSNDEVSRLAASFNKMLEKLEAAYNAQKRFSASAAHELRTPLSSMIAAIEVLKIDDSEDLSEYKEVTEDVYAGAIRLKTLIDNLLRLNAAGSLENPQKFDLKEIFDAILDELKQEAQKTKISLINNVEGCFACGDRDLLHRAFFNVVQNAVKYNKTGGSVKIEAEALEESDSPYLKISVTDTGIGIKEEEFEKIFEPFYCVDRSRSRECGGSGLGLSLVKTIIEKHGGKFGVDSELNKFTSVKILLPVICDN